MKKAQLYYWIIILAFGFGFFVKSAFYSPFYENEREDKAIAPFEIPKVFQPNAPLHLKPQKRKYINPYFPTFLGKFPFSTNLAIDNQQHFIADEDYLFYSGDSIETYGGDGLQLIPAPQIKLAELPYYRLDDSAHFPVFIVNETPLTKTIEGKDGHLFAIQEAKDSNGMWRPIEQRGFDFCGNGRWGLKIYPQEYGVFLMPLYEGSYFTELRVRFRNGDNIIISKSYKGMINYDQFYFEPDSEMKKHITHSPLAIVNVTFYGSYPLEYSQLSGR